MMSPQDLLHRWTKENAKKPVQKWTISGNEGDDSISNLASFETISKPGPHKRSTSASTLIEDHSTDEDSTAYSERSDKLAFVDSELPSDSRTWICELDEFKNSNTLRKTLTKPVTTRSEEQFVRSACVARELHAHEAFRYNAKLVLEPSNGLVSLMADEAGRLSGDASDSGELIKPKFIRVARHRVACLGPLVAPYAPPINSSINVGEPAKKDLERSMLLSNFVDKFAPVESIEISQDREEALLILRGIVSKWVKIENDKRKENLNLSDSEASFSEDSETDTSSKINDPGGTVLLSGSACFGVADVDSDVDAVCLVPGFVARESFFTTLLQLLQSNPDIQSILPISTAQVPLIRIVLKNVSIDLLMSRIDSRHIILGTLDISDDDILEGMDWQCVTSFSGPRNAEMIRSLVPNYSLFCTTLRHVRYWAKSRGIYSSKLGYLGGVSWAILVAFIVQLFPRSCSATCLYWFFEIYSRWDWSRNAVRLCANGGESWRKSRNSSSFGSVAGSPGIKALFNGPSLGEKQSSFSNLRVSSSLSLASYTSTNAAYSEADSEGMERFQSSSHSHSAPIHLMPIITPSSPVSDSAVSITHSGKAAVLMEFVRARTVMRTFQDDNQVFPREILELSLFELFAPFILTKEFKEYVEIRIAADTKEIWEKWLALIESRLRKLTTLLESVSCVERVRIDTMCRLTSSTSGVFLVGIGKTVAANAALLADKSARAEQDEAISRTVAFFSATHVGKLEGATFEVELKNTSATTIIEKNQNKSDKNKSPMKPRPKSRREPAPPIIETLGTIQPEILNQVRPPKPKRSNSTMRRKRRYGNTPEAENNSKCSSPTARSSGSSIDIEKKHDDDST